MADEIMHTVLPSSGGNAWGGTALGAGVGGLIGSWLGNGGFGGFGVNRGNAVAGYDTGLISGVSSQLKTINIVDSKEITPEVLRAEIYRKGLIYLSNPNDIQNIIDIGVLGLSIIMRK